MDRRTILALLISFMLVQGYFYFFVKPKVVEVAPEAPVAGAPGPAVPANPVTPVPVEAPSAFVATNLPFEYCDVKATVTTDGGALRDLTLPAWKADFKATAVWTWAWHRLSGSAEGGWHPYDTTGGPARLLTERSTLLAVGVGPTNTPAAKFTVVQARPDAIQLHATVGAIEVGRSYTAGPDCRVEVVTTWTNPGAVAWTGDLSLSAFDQLDESAGRFANPVLPIGMAEGDVVRWSSVPEEATPYAGPVQWFGMHDHYFGVFAVGGSLGNESLVFGPRFAGDVVLHGAEWRAPVSIAAGQAIVARQTLYVGPKQIEALAAVSPDLKNAIDLGYFGFFVRPLLWLLKFIYDYTGNWGLAIIVLTLLVKTALYPIQLRAFRSGQAMQDLQPKIKELQERYVDQPEELAKKQMELWTTSGANPVSGCLPMFAQLPVFISLYTMIGSAVEIHQQPFLYLQDLSSIDPIGILPLFVVAAMALQQRSMPMGNLDPAQQQVMQLMPLIFGVIMFSVPSGLVVYSLANILLSMLQQWWMKRVHTRTPAPAA
jgi:YidC/Oxa1 family membrane protein insertase